MLRNPEEKSNKALEDNLIAAVRSSGKDNTKDLQTAIDEIFAKRDYINNLIKTDSSSKGRLIAPSLNTQVVIHPDTDYYYYEKYKRAPALNLAIRQRKEDALKLLIESKADVNLCDEYDSTRGDFTPNIAGCTPLIIAAKNCDINCMTILLDNGVDDIHQINSAFTMVARGGDSKCMNLLTGKGININQRDSKGDTALTLAASRGDAQCMKLLIDKGANVNLKDLKGNTPLMIATKRGSTDCVELLITARANLTTKRYFGLFGKTALQMAREQDPPVCVKMLLEAQEAEKAERTKRFLYTSTSSVQHERKQESQDYNKLSPGPSYSSFDP